MRTSLRARLERLEQALTPRGRLLVCSTAAEAAGFKPHSGNAHRLSVNESVQARVAEPVMPRRATCPTTATLIA